MTFFGYLLVSCILAGLIIIYTLRVLKGRKSSHLAGTFKITTSLEAGTYLISVDDHKGKPIGSLIHYLGENLYDYSINDDGNPLARGHVEFVSKNEVNYVNQNGTKTAKLKLNYGKLLIFNDTRIKEYRMAS